jgi:hypothetical protein
MSSSPTPMCLAVSPSEPLRCPPVTRALCTRRSRSFGGSKIDRRRIRYVFHGSLKQTINGGLEVMVAFSIYLEWFV